MRGEIFEQPYSFANGITLRNGICLAPLDTRTALFDGEVSEADRYFHRRHASHVGLTIVGSAYVAQAGCTVTGSINIAEDKMVAGLTTLAQTIHQQGAKAVIQLVHAGRMTNRAATAGHTVVGPSAIAAAHGVVDLPEALTRDQITAIIDEFGAATQRAIQAGFDGVEIHGANSFLLQ